MAPNSVQKYVKVSVKMPPKSVRKSAKKINSTSMYVASMSFYQIDALNVVCVVLILGVFPRISDRGGGIPHNRVQSVMR
jgi:hypothetical protein